MVLSVAVGTALALLLEWRKLPGRYFVDALISAPLVLPPTVLGYYLVVALGQDSWLGRGWHALTGTDIVFSFTGAVIAASVGSLPLVVRSVAISVRAIDPNLIAAARTLGARPTRVQLTVVLPLAMPGIFAGAMLGFARALGDYGATMMFAGARIDGVPTGSIAVMDYLYGNREIEAREMGLVMTVVGVGMLYLANRLTRRTLPNRG